MAFFKWSNNTIGFPSTDLKERKTCATNYEISYILRAARLVKNISFIELITLKSFHKSKKPHPLTVSGVITHLGFWENTRKVCKSLALQFVNYKIFSTKRLITPVNR